MKKIKVALIVAHPDDETLWAGGTILSNPSWHWFIACLCRSSDTDRAPKFEKALKFLNVNGSIGDLNDGPEQEPLKEAEIRHAILELLPSNRFDLIITHNPDGEYTRHIRHEETGKTVINLWHKGKIFANELWTFAYEDGNKSYLPKATEVDAIYHNLTNQIWNKKFHIITNIYGFDENSWEAKTTPRAESFRKISSPKDVNKVQILC